MTEYIIFESCGYHFALPASAVDGIHEERKGGVSFSGRIFDSAEVELFVLSLKSGIRFRVHSVQETVLPEEALPVPGYIFENNNDWIQGILWDRNPRVLLLNEGALACILSFA